VNTVTQTIERPVEVLERKPEIEPRRPRRQFLYRWLPWLAGILLVGGAVLALILTGGEEVTPVAVVQREVTWIERLPEADRLAILHRGITVEEFAALEDQVAPGLGITIEEFAALEDSVGIGSRLASALTMSTELEIERLENVLPRLPEADRLLFESMGSIGDCGVGTLGVNRPC
jgi:hypothetical protein